MVVSIFTQIDMPPTVFGRAAIGDPGWSRPATAASRAKSDAAEHFMNKWRADFPAAPCSAAATGAPCRWCVA